MIEGIVPREIREGPDAIRATVDAAGASARASRRGMAARPGVRRVHVIGNGTSFHSSLASATLYRRHAGPDDPVVDPADRRGVPYATSRRLGPGDAVVGISSSGEFTDVVAVAEALRGRIPMAGIVHVPGIDPHAARPDIVARRRAARPPSRS